MKFKYFLIGAFIWSFFGACTFSVDRGGIDLQPITEYYETEEISVKKIGDTLSVLVKNPGLWKRNFESPKELKPNELFISTGALLISDQISPKSDIRYLKMKIQAGEDYDYSYNVEVLHFVKKCVAQSREVIAGWYEGKQEFVLSKLEPELVKDAESRRNTIEALSKLFTNNTFNDSQLIGYSFRNRELILFINVYFDNGEGQTYKVCYRLRDTMKISRILLPA